MKIVKYLFSLVVTVAVVLFVYKNTTSRSDLNSMSFVKNGSDKFYYVRYEATDIHNKKFGIAYFIYPIFENKREFLKLEYDPPLYNFEELLKGDGFGEKGSFKTDGGMFFSEILPYSVSAHSNSLMKWRMAYEGNGYSCTGVPSSTEYRIVSCASGKRTLSYRFKNDVGVDQYDDFCGNEVCHFRLQDKLGIFSDVHLRYVGLLGRDGRESPIAR